jgi:hypothetical protein
VAEYSGTKSNDSAMLISLLHGARINLVPPPTSQLLSFKSNTKPAERNKEYKALKHTST